MNGYGTVNFSSGNGGLTAGPIGTAQLSESKLAAGITNLQKQAASLTEVSVRLARLCNKVSGVGPPSSGEAKGPVLHQVETHLERFHRAFSENAQALEEIDRSIVRLEEAVG